jgi:hypothetical protein
VPRGVHWVNGDASPVEVNESAWFELFGTFMSLDQLARECSAGLENGGLRDDDGEAPISGAVVRHAAARVENAVVDPRAVLSGSAMLDASMLRAAANDHSADVEPVSGVAAKVAAEVTVNQPAMEAEVYKTQADVRTRAMHRFLSSQTDVSEEVLQLYKLVCTGFR